MLPVFSINNKANQGLRNPVLLSYLILKKALSVQFSNFPNRFVAEFCAALVNTARRSPLVVAVFIVVGVRSKKKMARINTPSHIAPVANKKTTWDVAKRKLIRETVGKKYVASSATLINYSVTTLINMARPPHTTVIPKCADTTTEPLYQRRYASALLASLTLACPNIVTHFFSNMSTLAHAVKSWVTFLHPNKRENGPAIECLSGNVYEFGIGGNRMGNSHERGSSVSGQSQIGVTAPFWLALFYPKHNPNPSKIPHRLDVIAQVHDLIGGAI